MCEVDVGVQSLSLAVGFGCPDDNFLFAPSTCPPFVQGCYNSDQGSFEVVDEGYFFLSELGWSGDLKLKESVRFDQYGDIAVEFILATGLDELEIKTGKYRDVAGYIAFNDGRIANRC